VGFVPRPLWRRLVSHYAKSTSSRGRNLIVEIDGHSFHSVRRSFERDRRRDQEPIGAGYRVVRVTWRQLESESHRLVATLTRALAERR